MMTGEPRLIVRDLAKSFTLHLQGQMHLPVITGATFAVAPGECVVLGGPSGIGKSSLLKAVYGTYRVEWGAIIVLAPDGPVEIARAAAHRILALRRTVIGHVSQFLRVIPRVPALEVVAAPARAAGATPDEASATAAALLTKLNVPERLWSLPPATFSGGEQQRVNIARGFAVPYPLLLLDEPTASLDAANRAAVVDLIAAARSRGAAILGIFHDNAVREAVADRIIDVSAFRTAA